MSIDGDGGIAASDCPNRYCCQFADGCDFVADSESLCALHRDPTAPLCGKCEEGFSELLGTVNCGLCDRDHWEYLVLPVVIAVAFSIYLLCFDKSAVAKAGMMSTILSLEFMCFQLFTVLVFGQMA